MLKLETAREYKPDSSTEILATKDELVYYYHNSAAGMVTICDQETNLIIQQRCFGSDKNKAIEWVKGN